MIGTALLLDNAMQEIQELDSFETMPALVTPLGLEILSSLDSNEQADNELDDETDDDTPIGNGSWFKFTKSFCQFCSSTLPAQINLS